MRYWNGDSPASPAEVEKSPERRSIKTLSIESRDRRSSFPSLRISAPVSSKYTILESVALAFVFSIMETRKILRMIMSSTSCGVRWGFVAAMDGSYRSNPNETEIENGIEIEIGIGILIFFCVFL